MNEKIKKLIKELANECMKEDIGLALSALDKQGEMTLVQAGVVSLSGIGILQQYEVMKKTLSESSCNCNACSALKEQFGIDSSNEEAEHYEFDFPEDVNDLFDKVLKDLRGAH